jgi:hypothetical protein
MFVFVTILRSVRSDFAPEIWQGLGVDPKSGAYARTEILVALGVLVLNGSAVFIADNRRAFFFAMALAVIGLSAVLASPLALRAGASPFAYMVLQGLGLYLPYIAVHTTIFERLIAMTRDRANLGYLMYVADAFGYLGYVAVLLTRNLAPSTGEFWPSYERLCIGISLASIAAVIPACWYFSTHGATQRHSSRPEPAASDAGAAEWVNAEGEA